MLRIYKCIQYIGQFLLCCINKIGKRDSIFCEHLYVHMRSVYTQYTFINVASFIFK